MSKNDEEEVALILPFKKEKKHERKKGHDVGFLESLQKQNQKKQMRQARRQLENNKDIIQSVRRGESIANIDVAQSWYPERPKIKKDVKEMKRLYGEDFEDDN
jgi:hypothetical protein